MTDKLKPCPFCGSDSLSCDGHFIECENCHAQGPFMFPIPDQAQCVDAWNTRPTTENKGGDNCERLARCPTCTGGINSTERRPDGDSICVMGHKHKTSEFFHYRPASPTKADKVEPLAVLADRKGFYISVSTRRPSPSKEWYISVAPKGVMQGTHFCEDGYNRTEAKARAFLTALDDVTGKGGR